MKAIFKKEIMSYFNSMLGYIFAAFLICAVGIYFMAMNIFNGYPNFSYALYNSLFVLMIAVPILTMRSMAEERHNQTDRLLFSSPLALWQIVFGKYLAMLAVFAVPVAVFCLFPLIIKMNGTAYLLSDYTAILLFFLLGAVYIAIGTFISSLTESQLISAVLTFAALLVLNLWNNLTAFLPSSALGSCLGFAVIILLIGGIIKYFTQNKAFALLICGILLAVDIACFIIFNQSFAGLLPTILNYFSPAECFYNAALYSTLDLKGVLLYLSLIFLFLFITAQTMQKRRLS